jgi:23S rRNA (cytidine1920-2'-O)/16S rRNA (cytidine1409-2'-O)-methyltransferase
MKERADKLLAARGLAPSREKAQSLIMAGLVSSGGKPVEKSGQLVEVTADLSVRETMPFVGRGGLKLAEALDRFKVRPEGQVAVDVGSSTGGFTDCLLQRGARKVFAVDVDTRQLDWRIRRDTRVVMIEKNARYLAPGDLDETPDLVVLDVSFISLLKVLPALLRIPGGWSLLALVKPQFEAGRREVSKKGIVRDPSVHEAVLEKIVREAGTLGLGLRGLIRCSTPGRRGNVEFFAFWDKGGEGGGPEAVQAWIKEAVWHEEH